MLILEMCILLVEWIMKLDTICRKFGMFSTVHKRKKLFQVSKIMFCDDAMRVVTGLQGSGTATVG